MITDIDGHILAPTDSPFDPVARPAHYNSHPSGVECKTIALHHSYAVGSALKYLWRAGLKIPQGESATAAAIRDLQKARQFLQFEIERLESL